MKLNLGCQIHYFEGWTNVDIVGDDPNVKVDICADVSSLPMIEDNSVDFIYAGHLVEHFYPDTLPLAIKEWHRVLKPGGKIVIVTPDCGQAFKDYASDKIQNINALWQPVYGRIYSYDTPSERHHMVFDLDTLMAFMYGSKVRENENEPFPLGIGWAKDEVLDFNNPPAELVPFMDSHISRGAYQLGLVLTK